MKDEFIAMKYKGKEWAIYARRCCCFVLFGAKNDIIKRCKILNNDRGVINE